MIGLKRGAVKLIPHHKNWKNFFKREKKKILAKSDDLIIDIQHIGSTAIPGIHAKPIIDISAGVKTLKDAEKLKKPLSKIGYNFYRKFEQQILFAKGPDRRRTHYLHVMKYKGAKWESDLLFRNFLLYHPVHAQTYTTLKKKLAKRYPEDREQYTAGKRKFIENTLKLAKNK